MKDIERAMLRSLASLLDVVEELANGLAAGQFPEPPWADVVTSTFAAHRVELLKSYGEML